MLSSGYFKARVYTIFGEGADLMTLKAAAKKLIGFLGLGFGVQALGVRNV